MSSWIIASTEPAPLEVANRTCHMVTTSYLLNKSLAFLTFLDIWGILPILNLLAEGTLTTRSGVGLSIAFIAYFCTTFWTFTCFFTWVCTNHNRTLRIRTPFQVRTLLDLQISDEKLVFVKSGHISKVSYQILRENDSTVRAWDLFDSHITDLHNKLITSYLM